MDENENKGIGGQIIFSPNTRTEFGFNHLYTDEADDQAQRRLPRNYFNVYFSCQNERWTVLLGYDMAFQGNTRRLAHQQSLATAALISAEAAAKYQMHRNWAVYGRYEYFHDPDNILFDRPSVVDTLTLPAEAWGPQGLSAMGGTAGVEFRPGSNAYLRLETRTLFLLSGRRWFSSPAGRYVHWRVNGMLTFGIYIERHTDDRQGTIPRG